MSAISQPTRPTQPSILSGSVNDLQSVITWITWRPLDGRPGLRVWLFSCEASPCLLAWPTAYSLHVRPSLWRTALLQLQLPLVTPLPLPLTNQAESHRDDRDSFFVLFVQKKRTRRCEDPPVKETVLDPIHRYHTSVIADPFETLGIEKPPVNVTVFTYLFICVIYSYAQEQQHDNSEQDTARINKTVSALAVKHQNNWIQ